MELSSSQFSIELPCGYSTYYKYLKNQPSNFMCTICGKHFIDKDLCFNEPKNRQIIKQSELFSEIESYNNLKKYLERIKNDPEMFVDKTFETLEFKISKRCNEMKENFCKQIDSYHLDIKERILKEKKAIIIEFKKKLSKCEFLSEDDSNYLDPNSSDNLDKIDEKLEKHKEYSSIITKLIKNISLGENFQLEDAKELNVHDYFGKIYASKQNNKNESPDFNFKCVKGFYGHTDRIKEILSLGNDRILSVSNDHTINLWDKATGKNLITFIGHTDSVLSIVLMNNQFFATGSKDKTIKIWNTGNKFCLKTLSGHTGAVISLKLLKNGEIISGSDDKSIKIWGKNIKTLNGHDGNVNCLDEKYDGLIVSGSADSLIKIWNVLSEKCLFTLTGHKTEVMDVKFFEKEILVSCSLDKTIKFWNTSNCTCIKTLIGHVDSVQQIAKFNHDYFVSCSLDGLIKVWENGSGLCITTIEAHHRPITCIKVTNSEELITGSIDGSIYIWNKISNLEKL